MQAEPQDFMAQFNYDHFLTIRKRKIIDFTALKKPIPSLNWPFYYLKMM